MATVIAGIVTAVCKSIGSVHDLYRNIQKASIEHKLSTINLTKEELDISERQLAFCNKASKDLVKAFGLTEEQEKLIERRVQGNSIMKLKILLSVYRRVMPLAEMQAKNKLKVTGKEK